MARAEERAVRELEQQIAIAQRRLTGAESQKRRRGGLFGGIFLGTVAGGLLTYYLTRRDQDEEWGQDGADNAIVLREQPVPTGQTATIKPLPKLEVAPAKQDMDDVAAMTLEELGESEQPTQQAPTPARPATLTSAAPSQAEQPKPAEAAAPAEQPKPAATAPTEQPKEKAAEPAKAETPKVVEQPKQDAPWSTEIERPEIPFAKASGNTDEELAEASSHEPAPASEAMHAEPVDGICPASHPIKGNRGNMGAMIYHVPGGRNYDRTKPEACFATIEEAEAAGYRAPRG